MYKNWIKRILDFTLSLLALIVLSPIFLILMALGAVMMQGNPFFTQLRPGRHEKIFRLIKFRTMSNARDDAGNLLSDEIRLNRYGRLLRSTSMDELPELINILKGDMSMIGPRPLVVEYLPYYTPEERQRHDVRPGVTGWAQVNGRNYVSWEDKFRMDLEYVRGMSFRFDLKIFFRTVRVVFARSDIETGSFIEHDGVIYRPLNEERKELQRK